MFGSAVAAAEPLEPRASLLVEPVAQPARRRLGVRDAGELREERAGGTVAHLLAARPTDGRIARHQENGLTITVLSGEALEHCICMGGEPHGERPDLALRPDPVEHDDPSGALDGDEAGEHVGELVPVPKGSRVEQVGTVEQVERRLQCQPPVKVEI